MPREAFDGIGEREKRLENRLMRQLNRSKPREERLEPCRREWRKMLALEEFAQEEDRAAKLSAKASRIEASFEAEMTAERAAAQLLTQKKGKKQIRREQQGLRQKPNLTWMRKPQRSLRREQRALMMCCRDRRQQTNHLPNWLERWRKSNSMKMPQRWLRECALLREPRHLRWRRRLSKKRRGGKPPPVEEEASEIKAAEHELKTTPAWRIEFVINAKLKADKTKS